MSAHAETIEAESGYPFGKPKFPEREYIIEHRATKETVLLCPGQFTEIHYDQHGKRIHGAGVDEDGPHKGSKEKVVAHHVVKCSGWRPLAGTMHATRMTVDEAAEFAKRHKWTKDTHRIFKA